MLVLTFIHLGRAGKAADTGAGLSFEALEFKFAGFKHLDDNAAIVLIPLIHDAHALRKMPSLVQRTPELQLRNYSACSSGKRRYNRSMKIFTLCLVSLLTLVGPLPSYAQTQPSADHTAREEAEGKEVWQQLQDKTITCDTLSDEQFGALGEYFMGQMMGDSHAAMNQMMIQMMGEEGEEQMHVVMGKRLSGCSTSATYPMSGTGFMPMMNMMMGGGFNMMNWGSGMPFFSGGLSMLLWWVLIIVGIALLVKWLMGQGKGQAGTTSALDVLKGRYAKGEISKQEFEDKKKDIS